MNHGLIKKGDTIIEATSGHSGIAFAFLAAERGYKCIIVMPRNMSEERKQMLRLYGAELIEVEDGKFEKALRQFKRKIEDNGLLQELRERQHYVKPSIRRKMAKNAAKRRWQKKVASEQLPKKLY